jgi:hypothetical protein
MHYVCNVEYESGYRLWLTFEDGSIRLVDLTAHLDGEVFEPLKDVRLFKSARFEPDLDTVVWANGADMSPDFLYELGVPSDTRAHAVAENRASYGKTDS